MNTDLAKAYPEPVSHAGPKSLDQHVAALDQSQHSSHGVGLLQIERDRATIAQRRIVAALTLHAGTIDVNDVGAEIGQQHCRVGPRADAGHFHDLEPGK